MFSRKLGSGLAVGVLCVGLSACGGDDKKSSGGSGGGSGDTLSKAALIAKANQICAQTQKDARAVKAPPSLADPVVASKYLDKIAPITAKETADLKALKPADDVKADYEAFLKAQQAADDLIQTIRDKAAKKDASGTKDLAKAAGLGKAVADTATKLGASTCAGG